MNIYFPFRVDVFEDVASLSAVLLLLQTTGVRDARGILTIPGPGPILEPSLPGVGTAALVVSLDRVPLGPHVLVVPVQLDLVRQLTLALKHPTFQHQSLPALTVTVCLLPRLVHLDVED